MEISKLFHFPKQLSIVKLFLGLCVDFKCFPDNICLFKVNNGNTRAMCEIYSKSCSGACIVNLEQISNIVLIFPLFILTLSRRRSTSYRNQSTDLLRKSMHWFLYDIGLRRERVKQVNDGELLIKTTS